MLSPGKNFLDFLAKFLTFFRQQLSAKFQPLPRLKTIGNPDTVSHFFLTVRQVSVLSFNNGDSNDNVQQNYKLR